MSSTLTDQILQALEAHIVPGRAARSAGYFKAGPGQYGEGDQFWGITVPDQRLVVRQFADQTGPTEWDRLTAHPIHEARLTGWLCVVQVYRKDRGSRRQAAAQFCLDHLDRLNNWDLVDSTAPYVLGPEFYQKGDQGRLEAWAGSGHLWLQRVAVLTTAYFIRQGDFAPTLTLADRLLDHPHDLIHKAVGWMLREVGNQDLAAEEAWLASRYRRMPRTMLRYAIEKFPEDRRQAYLKGQV